MKNLLVGLMTISAGLCSCSQELPAGKVPSVVQNVVQSGFSAAADIEWEKKGSAYEAEFRIDGIDHSILVDSAGKIRAHKSGMIAANLPAAVVVAIEKENGVTIDDAEKLEMNGFTYYQVELEAEGKKDRKLVYHADGNIATQIKYID